MKAFSSLSPGGNATNYLLVNKSPRGFLLPRAETKGASRESGSGLKRITPTAVIVFIPVKALILWGVFFGLDFTFSKGVGL